MPRQHRPRRRPPHPATHPPMVKDAPHMDDDWTLHPVKRFEWERLIRRVQLGPDDVAHLHTASRPVASLTVKAVGFALATYASKDGSHIWPGDAKVARVLGTTPRSVRDARAVLEAVGLIEKTGGGARGKAFQYRLTIPEDLIELVPMLDVDEQNLQEWGDDTSPVGGTTRPHPTGRHVPPTEPMTGRHVPHDRTPRPQPPDDTSAMGGRHVPPPIQDQPKTNQLPTPNHPPVTASYARARAAARARASSAPPA